MRLLREGCFFRTISTASLLLAATASASAAQQYARVGHTTDSHCPAHLALEEGFVQDPGFTVSPDRALALSGIRCPNKLEVTVYSDSENYYITTLGLKPGAAYTRVVNGKTGKSSAVEPAR